jgi:hypothetical protein
MLARRFGSGSLVVVLTLAFVAGLSSVAAQGNSEAAQACRDGYADYLGPDGLPFTNAGQCVRWAAQGNDLVPVDEGPGPDPELNACELEAVAYGLDPTQYAIVVGTDGPDVFSTVLSYQLNELVCGFGGDDFADLQDGDVFLGGAGNDFVDHLNAGAFYGGEGDDSATVLGPISTVAPAMIT